MIKETISSNVKIHTNSIIKSICVNDNDYGGEYFTITETSNEENNKSHRADCVILATRNSQLGLSLLKSPQINYTVNRQFRSSLNQNHHQIIFLCD